MTHTFKKIISLHRFLIAKKTILHNFFLIKSYQNQFRLAKIIFYKMAKVIFYCTIYFVIIIQNVCLIPTYTHSETTHNIQLVKHYEFTKNLSIKVN